MITKMMTRRQRVAKRALVADLERAILDSMNRESEAFAVLEKFATSPLQHDEAYRTQMSENFKRSYLERVKRVCLVMDMKTAEGMLRYHSHYLMESAKQQDCLSKIKAETALCLVEILDRHFAA